MSTQSQPATIQADGYTITSSHESAEDMIATHTPQPENDAPTVVEADPEKAEAERVSKAAAELGKKGGEAAAAARKAAEKEKAKEAAPEKPEEAEPEVKPEEKPDTRKGNPRHDPQARIAQVLREKREVEEAAAEERRQLTARLAELERKVAPAGQQPEARQQPKPQAAPDDDPEPKEDDFEAHAEYVKALGAHSARQEFRRQERVRSERQRQEAYFDNVGKHIDRYNEACEKAARENPAFRDAAKAVEAHLPGPTPTARGPEDWSAGHALTDEFLLSGEKAPSLLLYFAEHPDELQRILALPVRTARGYDELRVEVRAIAKGLGAVTAGTSAKPRVSQAPPPVRPVTGVPHAAADSDPDAEKDDYDTYVRKVNAKERRR